MIVLALALIITFSILNTGGNETPPLAGPNQKKTAYGIEMQAQCYDQLQDFIKNFGADYLKCLSDIDLNEEYCSGFNPDTQGLSDVNIVVILDASGSMAEKINLEEKISIAKKAVSDFLTKMPPGVKTGLVVYGHKGSNLFSDKSLSCSGVEEVVKLGENNSSSIINAINSFNPKGWTPIAGAINFVKDIFKNKGENDKNYLVLVSDGVESCDGNPLSAAEDLKLEIKNINLSIIGFTNDTETEKFLEKISSLGGGSYMTAFSSSQIARALNDQLRIIKEDCINGTLLKIYSRNEANNTNNLNCWLTAQKKESDDFTANISNSSLNSECSQKISDVLQLRASDFWYEKEKIKEKNSTIYEQIRADFESQLKILEDSKIGL